jgi:UDP-N-acetylmuramoylalanine--D-glutamate ligase
MRPTISWSDLRGRRVGVWGIGVEGRASVRRLELLDVEPVLVEDAPSEPGVLATGEGGLDALSRCEVVVKSPGISRYRDEVVTLRGAGVEVVGGLGLWLAGVDRSRVACITGTKGKSTTTSIVAALLAGLGRRVFAGGNLGSPPYDPGVDVDVDLWVIEVSSYQATDVALSPPVTAVTSLHPDHLPWHAGSVERYYDDKLSLCSQPGARVTVANGDSDLLRARAGHLAPSVRWVHADDDPGSTWPDRLGLLGTHNRRNALIARACIEELGVDVTEESLAVAADGFEPLGSRLSPVATADGVLFVDDSLSTNVLAALAAVDAFPGRRLALLVGGADRGIDHAPLAAGLAERPWPTVVEILDSESAGHLREAFAQVHLPDHVEVRGAPDIESATLDGFRWARPDGVVLLSPAAPSFDRYRSYRERAAAFVDAVQRCH